MSAVHADAATTDKRNGSDFQLLLLLLLLLLVLLLQSVYEIRYRLPKDFTCDRCILQWHYLTGNSCWCVLLLSRG
jgi:hypothetical protein